MRSASAMSVQEEKLLSNSRRAQMGPSHKSLTYFAIRPRRACDPNSWNEQSGSFGTVTAYQRQLYRCRTRWYAHLIKMLHHKWIDREISLLIFKSRIEKNLLKTISKPRLNLPAVGKYLVIGPLWIAGRDCPWLSSSFWTKVLSISRAF